MVKFECGVIPSPELLSRASLRHCVRQVMWFRCCGKRKDVPSSSPGWRPDRGADAGRPCCPEPSSSASPSPVDPAAPAGTATGGGGRERSLISTSNDATCNIYFKTLEQTTFRRVVGRRLGVYLASSLSSGRGGGCGAPDAISGVYWPAGRREAPPRPLIRGLPGRPHCLPDTSMLITQSAAVTEGGCPSA